VRCPVGVEEQTDGPIEPGPGALVEPVECAQKQVGVEGPNGPPAHEVRTAARLGRSFGGGPECQALDEALPDRLAALRIGLDPLPGVPSRLHVGVEPSRLEVQACEHPGRRGLGRRRTGEQSRIAERRHVEVLLVDERDHEVVGPGVGRRGRLCVRLDGRNGRGGGATGRTAGRAALPGGAAAGRAAGPRIGGRVVAPPTARGRAEGDGGEQAEAGKTRKTGKAGKGRATEHG
jgi:hypothetical protein